MPTAADTLISKVDCLNNPDRQHRRTGAAHHPGEKANAKGIPVFGSEIEQVKIGCLAAEGLDYVELGKTTGKDGSKGVKGRGKGFLISLTR